MIDVFSPRKISAAHYKRSQRSSAEKAFTFFVSGKASLRLPGCRTRCWRGVRWELLAFLVAGPHLVLNGYCVGCIEQIRVAFTFACRKRFEKLRQM